MTTAERIAQQVASLPEDAQQEVLDFVEFIQARKRGNVLREDGSDWSYFSLASAMRGMEEEPSLYTVADLKESFR